MDWYLFVELFLFFIFGMGMFIFLVLFIGIFFDLVWWVMELGFFMDIVVKILFLKMLEFVVLVFFMLMLLVSLMVYSCFFSDSELIVLCSIGVSIYCLVVFVLLFGIVVMGIVFVFNDCIIFVVSYEVLVILDWVIY